MQKYRKFLRPSKVRNAAGQKAMKEAHEIAKRAALKKVCAPFDVDHVRFALGEDL